MSQPDFMEAPAQLSRYFAASSVALSLAAADGDNELLLVNAPFERLTGYTPADVVGRNCRLLQRDTHAGMNRQARADIHRFLANDRVPNVRSVMINVAKDGTPFVNLLYMSKLRDLDGQVRFLFGSQFDISRTQPDRLAQYDDVLTRTLARMDPLMTERGLVIEGSLLTIANSAAIIAQARYTLSRLDGAAS